MTYGRELFASHSPCPRWRGRKSFGRTGEGGLCSGGLTPLLVQHRAFEEAAAVGGLDAQLEGLAVAVDQQNQATREIAIRIANSATAANDICTGLNETSSASRRMVPVFWGMSGS